MRAALLLVVAWASVSTGLYGRPPEGKKPAAPLYHEQYRPQFHFSPRKNWTNDPNGLVFYKGQYHLFFQHNPRGLDWGNMTWGHAVSPDLFHWKQLPDAIEPDRLGTIFSGSAVVDWDNTAGFQAGDDKVIVCIYTSAGGTSPESKGQPFSQSIAYSADGGRTWKKYEKNPVLKHIVGGNRDPKVFWHAPTKQWCMALYLDKDQYALFGSPDLKQWTKLSDVPPLGAGECPDLFEMPLDGDAGKTKWVFWGGNNKYLVGSFDGKNFLKEGGPFRFEHGANYYAAQTYSDVPAPGRRIQIAWMAGGRYPGMPFNQQMSLPSELRLRTFPEGIRLCRQPVAEIDALHGEHYGRNGVALAPGDNPLAGFSGELWDIRAEIAPGDAAEIGFMVRGFPVVYDAAKRRLGSLGKTAPLEPLAGRIKLEIVVDRASIEVFGNDGKVSLSSCFLPPSSNKSLAIFAKGGTARIESLDVWKLTSVWP